MAKCQTDGENLQFEILYYHQCPLPAPPGQDKNQCTVLCLVFPKCLLNESRVGVKEERRESTRVEERAEDTKQFCGAGFRLIFLVREEGGEPKALLQIPGPSVFSCLQP